MLEQFLNWLFPAGSNPLVMVVFFTAIFILGYSCLCLLEAWLINRRVNRVLGRHVNLPSEDS